MHSSSPSNPIKTWFQKTWVKVTLSVILFLAFVLLISWGLFYPYGRIYSNDNQFGLIVLGASESVWGVNPEVVEENTGKKTCILASLLCDYDGRYEMLKAAIDQDSLDMVVLDASNTSLAIKWDALDELYFTKINGFGNKLAALKNFSFWDDQYDQVYAESLNSGLTTWAHVLDGTYEEVFRRHGYEPQEHQELPFTDKFIGNLRSTQDADQTYIYERLDWIRDIVELCREKEKEVIIVTYPVTAMSNYMFIGWDHFHNTMKEFTDYLEVPYYDFNLLVDRGTYLPDDLCFRDGEHLCAEGADRFSVMLSQLINSHLNGEEVPFDFYDSYEEAQDHSYYVQFIDPNIDLEAEAAKSRTDVE